MFDEDGQQPLAMYGNDEDSWQLVDDFEVPSEPIENPSVVAMTTAPKPTKIKMNDPRDPKRGSQIQRIKAEIERKQNKKK